MPERCVGLRESMIKSMRTKLEENAGSGDFWKCVRTIGLT